MLLALAAYGTAIKEYVPYIFGAGAACFSSMQLSARYEGDNFTIRRLRRQQILGALLLLITTVPMWMSVNHVWPLGHNEWLLFLAVGAWIELYTAFRIPIRNFDKVWALTFSYGQKHVSEVEAAERIAREAGVAWEHMDVPMIGTLAKNSLTNGDIIMDETKPENSVPNTFVPGRNLFFISIAAVYARERNIRNIVTGVGQTDFSGYPDCRDTFIRSLNVSINLAMDEQFVIHTPLMWKDKAETWAMADQLGVLDIVRDETVTCYNGVKGDGCGHCPACELRRKGLEEYLNNKEKYGRTER